MQYEVQLRFIQEIQSRLIESKVVTSYKYSLLHAIADLSVLKASDHPGDELVLSLRELAERWVELYEPQTKLYPVVGETPVKLNQSATAGRSVLELISDYQASMIKPEALHKDLMQRIKNPITRLYPSDQANDNFLYKYIGDSIVLKPYVAFCFKKHYDLVISLIRERWISFVRRQNESHLSESKELGGFLFGVERSSLKPYKACLLEVAEEECFYCSARSSDLAVDHFVPWSKYSVDLGHNFVLACTSCNSSKSDHLAASEHLHHWSERNRLYGDDLNQLFQERSLPSNLNASVKIAQWVYQKHIELGGDFWKSKSKFEPLTHIEGLIITI